MEREADIATTAADLQRDLDARRPRQLFVAGRGPRTVREAYALQRAVRSFREARGEIVVGFKVGFTSPTIRAQLVGLMGIDHSVHGYLWDTEQKRSGATVDHRRFGVEGELAVTLLSTDGDDVSQWEVEYQPIIEVHSMGIDGPHDGRGGVQLISTNCIHAGVVHSSDAALRRTKRCLLGEVPLDERMAVHVAGRQLEQVTLMALQVDGVHGPVATVNWLLQTLRAEGNGEDALIAPGAVVLCSTPGGLYDVSPGVETVVTFDGMTATCIADTPRP